jgi:hypothetical protein
LATNSSQPERLLKAEPVPYSWLTPGTSRLRPTQAEWFPIHQRWQFVLGFLN